MQTYKLNRKCSKKLKLLLDNQTQQKNKVLQILNLVLDTIQGVNASMFVI